MACDACADAAERIEQRRVARHNREVPGSRVAREQGIDGRPRLDDRPRIQGQAVATRKDAGPLARGGFGEWVHVRMVGQRTPRSKIDDLLGVWE